MLRIAKTNEEVGDLTLSLDEIARAGARRMLQEALEAEVADYVERFQGEQDEHGRSLVVRNGKARTRKITTGAGTFEIESPRVNDKRIDSDGERMRFASKIIPPYMRKSPKIAELLPLAYLRGLSTGDFREVFSGVLGEDASGLSSSAITRLTNQWEAEYKTFRRRDLSNREYVYIWADGIHFNVRLEEERLCTLVLIGARKDGTKELIAVEDGYRESADSWAALLRDLKCRGLEPPLLAIADGALGFWKAARDVWPETKEQRCWVHKIRNVLDKLPKSVRSIAKKQLHEIMEAETRENAKKASGEFEEMFSAKYPKAVECLQKDFDKLLTLYEFPAEQWIHIRTTNPIESTFATVRLRQRVTKGAGSRVKALTMAFKLMEMAEKRWRRLRGYKQIEKLVSGVRFKDGNEVEQNQEGRAAA